MATKRGRKAQWWGWDFFSSTPDTNESGNSLYQCCVVLEKDKNDKDVLCCELLAYSGSPSNFKSHLSTKHRLWHAEMKAKKEKKPEKKQARLFEFGVTVEEKNENSQSAEVRGTETDLKELDEDLLSYVV